MNWKRSLILAFILLTVGLIISWASTPSITEIQPTDSPLISRQPIVIAFSRPMNPVSVYAHFSLEPSVQGDLLWNEDFTQGSFTPDKPWPSGESIRISVESGAKSRFGFPLLRSRTEEITINSMALVYLWPADGNSNLFIMNPESGETRQLTFEEEGILDYSTSRDGKDIFYSHHEEGEGSSILSFDRLTGDITQLITCSTGLCRSPQVSPDGGYLAYEFISSQSGIQPGIQVYDLNQGIEIELGDPEEHLDNPTWSPSGWLSYYNYTRLGFEFWNPDADETVFLPNETGGNGSWSPDGRYFICSEIQFKSTNLAPRHLIIFDQVEGTLADLSQGNFLEDLNPSFSPQGSFLAFSRKYLNPEDWTPGRELWVMDLEENQSFQLTDEVDFHHSSFTWHPDGDRLVYVRYNQAKLSEPPEIWLINRDGQDKVRLVINGFAPTWIP